MKLNEGARKINKYIIYTKMIIWIMTLAMIGIIIGTTIQARKEMVFEQNKKRRLISNETQ